MEDAVRRGFRWTFLGFALNRGLGILTTLFLARTLAPRDFGTVTFALVVIAIAQYLLTLGVGPAIIIRPDLNRSGLGTGLTLLISGNLAAIAVVGAVSPVAARFLDAPDAERIILALAAPLVVAGIATFYDVLLQRELEFKRDFAVGAGQVFTVSIVALVAAAAGAGVWSLVFAQIAGALVRATIVFLLAPFHVRPSWDRDVARSLWREGRGFAVQGVTSFVEQNTDYLVVGSTMGAGPLGLYGLGYRISEVPYNAIVEPISQVTFPGFARLRASGKSAAGPFLSTLGLITLCTVPVGVILAASAAPFVHALLNSRWNGLATVLPILALWGTVRSIQGTIGWFVNSIGFAHRVGTSYAVMLLATVPLLAVSAHLFGLRGVAGTMLLNVVVMLFLVGRIASRHGGAPWRAQWHAVRQSVLAAIPTAVSVRAIVVWLNGARPQLLVVLATGIGVAVYVLAIALIRPGLLTHAVQQLRRTIRPITAGVPGTDESSRGEVHVLDTTPEHPDRA